MNILITNDDGINAPALPYLVDWAKKFGDVTVVAPKFEQSGKSQAIDFRNSVEAVRVYHFNDCEAWSLDSTPADCVRFAVRWLKKKYDLVISGINRGYNLGNDIAYSGTVGAVFEASRLGMKAVAVSSESEKYDLTTATLDVVFEYVKKENLFDTAHLLNINIPVSAPCGIAVTRQGGEYFTDDYSYLGNDMYIQVGDPINEKTDDISVDIGAVKHNYISITPLSEIHTDIIAFEKLKNIRQKFN